jgi:hypothetical protein
MYTVLSPVWDFAKIIKYQNGERGDAHNASAWNLPVTLEIKTSHEVEVKPSPDLQR